MGKGGIFLREAIFEWIRESVVAIALEKILHLILVVVFLPLLGTIERMSLRGLVAPGLVAPGLVAPGSWPETSV